MCPESFRIVKPDVLTPAVFERQMGEFSRRLDRENLYAQASNYMEMGNVIEKDVISLDYYETLNESMIQMVEWQKQKGETEPIVGVVFLTGVNDGIGMCVLLPTRTQDKLGETDMGDVVYGTPTLIQFQDADLAEKLQGLSYQERVTESQKILKQKRERVRTGEAKMNVNWGGWGSVPWYLIHRQQLIQECATEEGISYELSVSMGFMGSAFTLNKEYMQNHPETMKKLKLSMFSSQVESALSQLGKMLDPERDPIQTMAELSPDLIGHSMGGYLILWAAKMAYGNTLSVIDVLRLGGLSRFVADKPVIMGSRWLGEKPNWIEIAVNSPMYRDQVKLQAGIKGMIVRAGVSKIWESHPALASIREMIGPNLKLIDNLFSNFLTPEKMWDGPSVAPIHKWSYFWDRAYHAVCVDLLDKAEPVMSSKTMTRVSEKLNFVKIIMGGGDEILGHTLTMALAAGVPLPTENVSWRANVAHHPNLSEIRWAMGIVGLR
jgi:hypothetical protein